MKRLLSTVLALLLLFSCISSPARAIVPGEDTIAAELVSSLGDTDELFRIRAQLLMDPSATQSDIEKIDNQLFELGVERISQTDVLKKIGITAEPMYNVSSTSDTAWFSQRRVTVANGRQYEVQIITGQWNNQSSPLCDYISGVKRECSGKAVGAVNALQVIANDVLTSSIGNEVPVIGDALSVMTTLYDVQKAYYDGLSPTTVFNGAEYSFDILVGTTAKFGFVKSYGAVDEGNQILGYVGNQVDYSVYIDIPTFTNTNGVQTMGRTTVTYSDFSTSHGFDNDTCVAIAAQNCWLHQYTNQNLNVYHDIYRIPIKLIDVTENISVPYEFPYIS